MNGIALRSARGTQLSLVCAALLGLHSSVLTRADEAADGKSAFAACSACHSVDGSKRLGPSLNGIVGRKAGSVADFNYSPAMKRSSIVWDAPTLDKFLANPQQEVPGTRMPFSGLPDANKRAQIEAYRATLK
jgi:cytochrome c